MLSTDLAFGAVGDLRRGTGGFRADFGWLEVPGAIAEGVPEQVRGVSPVPGLFYLGLPWQHTRGSALLGFVRDDAAWLADRLAVDAAAPVGA